MFLHKHIWDKSFIIYKHINEKELNIMELFRVLLLIINFSVYAAQTSPSASPALLIPVGHLEEYIKAEVTRQFREISKDVIKQAVEEKIREVNKEVIKQEVNKQIQQHATTGKTFICLYI